MTKQEQWMTYAVMISGAISTLFEEDSPNYVGDDFLQEADLTQFFHALANVVPAQIYEKITGTTTDYLGFNHIANRLCMQYGFLYNPEENKKK